MKKFNKKEYDKKNRVRITLFLSKENDADILDVIDPENKQGSIKRYIRKAIEKDQ